MKKIIVGVIGPGESAREIDLKNAYELGRLIAQAGWVLLTGGRNTGVMDAASRGAKQMNGITIGILPADNLAQMSDAVDIPIVTDMGNARNNINVLSSDLVIACGMGAGTASEIALALKAHKKVILLNSSDSGKAFFQSLSAQDVYVVDSPIAAITIARSFLSRSQTKNSKTLKPLSPESEQAPTHSPSNSPSNSPSTTPGKAI